jgi:hypothetical protein
MEAQDPAVEALMAELKSVVDGSELSVASNALEESTHIFTELCKEFDRVIPERVGGTMAVVYTLDDEGNKQAREEILSGSADYIKDAGTTDDDVRSGRGTPAKVEVIAPSIEASEMLNLLSDTEGSILLNAWKDPVSLITRVRRGSDLLQVMASASVIVYIKTLPTGDTITKNWSCEVAAPKREDFDSEYEHDLVKLTYSYLAEPHIIKQKSPEAFQILVDSISHKMERQVKQMMESEDEDEG